MITGIILFRAFFLLAQHSPDSVPVGVIQVKRPPVAAAYRVSSFYQYPDQKQTKTSKVVEHPTDLADSVSGGVNPYAPQPQNLDLYRSSPEVYSAVYMVFDWQKYLSSLNFTFLWADSIRLDSAQYQFTLDKKGKATCKPLPLKNTDSTGRAFEDKTKAYATVLTKWFPARVNKKTGSSRMKKVPCTVIVTIYAYDPNAGRLMPIENKINNAESGNNRKKGSK